MLQIDYIVIYNTEAESFEALIGQNQVTNEKINIKSMDNDK